MHRHVKVAKEKPEEKKSSMKWWITAGVLAFVLVCAFIGITLWLGLNVESEDNNRGNNNANFNKKDMSSSARTEKQQVVLGTADQKIGDGSQGEESDGKHIQKKQDDKSGVTPTTELLGSPDKDLGEDAYVEEVHKSQKISEENNVPVDTTVVNRKESLTSGSPLYPQPIPETPAFVPEEPTPEETVTTETASTSVTISRQNASEQESTPVSSTGIDTEKAYDIRQQIFDKPDNNTDDLLETLFHNPTQENRPSFEEDVDNSFRGEENTDIRQFFISDAANEKRENID